MAIPDFSNRRQKREREKKEKKSDGEGKRPEEEGDTRNLSLTSYALFRT